MPHAVVKTGGKQYLVSPGQRLRVEKLSGLAGESVTLCDVLLTDTAGNIRVGSPTIAGATVAATILQQGRGQKITVQKYKPKVRYRRKRGHRQLFTELKIESISA